VAAVLKLCRLVENPTPSIDAYLLEEQFCQISIPIPFGNDGDSGFLKRSPQQEEQEQKDE